MVFPHFNNNVITQTNQSQSHVITDFVQRFELETGLNITSCREIIQDSNSIFHGFSYLIANLLFFFDSHHCHTYIIKGLTVPQRRDFYVELSKIGIHFVKNKYLHNNHNYYTDIHIFISDRWSVPDYRTNPELAIYQHHINVFNVFYSRVNNLGTTTDGNIIVLMRDFLDFKRIFSDARTSYNQQRYINYNYNNISFTHNQTYSHSTVSTATQLPFSKPGLSSNSKIKHQLADLIFDVKDNLTDAMYKEILEKIALISK